VSAVKTAGTNAITVTYSGIGMEGGGLKLRGQYGFDVCYGKCDNVTSSIDPLDAANAGAPQTLSSPEGMKPRISSNVGGFGWYQANLTAVSGSTVTVNGPASMAGQTITKVRYGHDDMPTVFLNTGPAIFNAEGLPATPGIYVVSP